MNKQKKIIIFLSIIFCICFIISGIFFGMTIQKNNKYNFNFLIQDTLHKVNNKKAKVILLAGQSNASGCSLNEYLERNVSTDKFTEFKNGYDNIYINYYSSGNNVSNGFVKTSINHGETIAHFGPEVGLAEKLHQLYPEETIFIIKFAWGGTNLFSQWLSPSSIGKTGSLYDNFIRFVNLNMEYLESKGYNPVIEGMCWMQGESDSFFVKTANDYELNLKNFIKDMRRNLSRYQSNDGIAFVDAYIAASPAYWVYYDLVNKSKQSVANSSSINSLIDTISYGLTTDQEPEGTPDIPHYDSLSEVKLGNLFAEYVSQFFD